MKSSYVYGILPENDKAFLNKLSNFFAFFKENKQYVVLIHYVIVK